MPQDLLTAVRLVSDSHPDIALPLLVAHKIDSFILDTASQWTLESASERGFHRLLDRLLSNEWPGFNQKFRQKRLDCAVTKAYNERVVRWWLEWYMPGQPMSPVCSLAIGYKRIQALEWLLVGRQHQLTPVSLQCNWSPEIAYWLYEHDRRLPLLASIDHIKWSKAVEEDQAIVWPTIMSTISRSQLELIQRLRGDQLKPDTLETALRYGRLDVAKWLYENFQNVGLPRLCCAAYLSNSTHQCQYCKWKRVDLEIARWVFCDLDWIDQEARTRCAKRMVRIAAFRGDLELVKFVFEVTKMPLKNPIMPQMDIVLDPECIDDTAANGHLSVVQWLHEHHQPCTTKAMNRAAGNGHLEVIRWLHKHRTEGCTTDAMDNAAGSGHIEVVQWLHENRTEGCTTQAMDYAVLTRQLEILQWLHKNRSEGWSQNLMRNVMYSAQISRLLEIVQWLHEIGAQEWSTWTMDVAAKLGRLDVVVWLHENRNEGCTTYAMDYAASKGHLEIVKWLHENRSEGCTTLAMRNAASEGHLEIVKWLHENRSEGCTTAAMNFAAKGGHFKIVQWLHENRSEGCTTDAMDNAVWIGRLDLVRFLHENQNVGCSNNAQIWALNRGDVEMFKWLHENRPERCSRTSFLQQQFREPGSLDVLEFAAHYSEYAPLDFSVGMLIKRGRFGAAESILREAHVNGISLAAIEYVDIQNLRSRLDMS